MVVEYRIFLGFKFRYQINVEYGSSFDSIEGAFCITCLISAQDWHSLRRYSNGQYDTCSPNTHSSLHLPPTSQVHTLAIFEYVPTAIFADSNGLSFQLIDVIPCSDS